MTIGGISGNANAGAGIGPMNNQGMDSYSKSLQKQIADAQKQLQELSQNNEIDPETKMKKRQEIQKQISDLNMQLRQHQMEERRKAQQEAQAKSRLQKAQESGAGMSQSSMTAIISAEGSMKQAKVHGSVAKQSQNSADIKRSEIKRDGGSSKRSADDNAAISRKWDDVESLEETARAAAASQMSLLAEASNTMSEAAKTESSTDTKKTEKSDAKAEGKEKDEAVTAAGEAESGAAPAESTETVRVTDAPAPDSTAASKTKTAEIGSNVDVRI